MEGFNIREETLLKGGSRDVILVGEFTTRGGIFAITKEGEIARAGGGEFLFSAGMEAAGPFLEFFAP